MYSREEIRRRKAAAKKGSAKKKLRKSKVNLLTPPTRAQRG
jgi:hypothetical protein